MSQKLLNRTLKYVPFQCNMCNKTFPTESKLNHHVSGVHFKLTNHPCHLCEKKFSENLHLKQHVDMIHHEIKNYACETCERRFARTQKRQNIMSHSLSTEHDLDHDEAITDNVSVIEDKNQS